MILFDRRAGVADDTLLGVANRLHGAAAARCELRATRCDVIATNRLFGDPCALTPKYLEVQFRCETGKQLPR